MQTCRDYTQRLDLLLGRHPTPRRNLQPTARRLSLTILAIAAYLVEPTSLSA